ncbi:MAG: hypothetical protein ACR2OU_00170 [Thermomicrobiales bacterium]
MSALDEILEVYREQPTDNLISDTIIISGEGGLDSLRRARAATLGYSRAGYYLDTARSLMRQMMEDTQEIAWRMDAYALFAEDQRDDLSDKILEDLATKAVKAKQVARYLSIQAEIFWHFYVASLQHAWYFMQHCAQAVDPEFSFAPEGLKYLTLIRAFRNHMEHRDKAAGDLTSGDWQSMSRIDREKVLLGYRRDRHNNIHFVPINGPLGGIPQQMPMNPEGFEKFESMFIDSYERLRDSCIQRLEQYLSEHPEKTPNFDQVGGTLTDYMEPVQ